MYSHIDIFKNHSFIAIFKSLVKAPEKCSLAFIMLPKKIFFFLDNNFWISSEIIFVSFVDRGCEPLKTRSKIYGSLVCLAQFLQKGYNITTLEFPHLDSYRSYLVENFTTFTTFTTSCISSACFNFLYWGFWHQATFAWSS